MRFAVIAGCALLSSVVPAFAQQQVCQYIGTQVYCSGGLQGSNVGDGITYWNNGTTMQQLGDQLYITPLPVQPQTQQPRPYVYGLEPDEQMPPRTSKPFW